MDNYWLTGRAYMAQKLGKTPWRVSCVRLRADWPLRSGEVLPVLADAYGRVATDLRLSLTDRCNLRCSYCMPPEGLEWLPVAPRAETPVITARAGR